MTSDDYDANEVGQKGRSRARTSTESERTFGQPIAHGPSAA